MIELLSFNFVDLAVGAVKMVGAVDTNDIKARRTRTSDELLGKMWKTKSARFNAHQRLARKHNLSTWATSILAFYIFVASLLPLFYPKLGAEGADRLLAVITIIISVFLIIVTLLENSKKYDREADRMLDCALEISELYNRFQSLPTDQVDEKRVEFNDNYSEVLKRYGLNHKEIDFLRFSLLNAAELNVGGGRYILDCLRFLICYVTEYWLYFVLVVIPPMVAYLLRGRLGF